MEPITDDQIRSLLEHVRQGHSVARSALYAGIPASNAYGLKGKQGRLLSRAVKERNQRYGIGWTDELAATSDTGVNPSLRSKRRALRITRKASTADG